MASFTAAGTAYATWGQPMIPFFIFYSMFGFQRVGDLIWPSADMRGRAASCSGAPPAARPCSARASSTTTATRCCWPRSCPTVARLRPGVRLRDGDHRRATASRRMYGPGARGLFYYLTLYNENYPMPALPVPEGDEAPAASASQEIVRGIYRFAGPAAGGRRRARRGRRRSSLLGAATAVGKAARPRSCSQAAWQAACSRAISPRLGRAAELWSVTSYKALREDALSVERWNRLHPGQQPRSAVRDRAARRRRRADRGRHRLHEGGARPDRPLGAGAASSRSAPTGSAAPTPGRRCAGISRSTPPTSWSPCSTGSPRPARPRPSEVAAAIERYGVDADAGPPGRLSPAGGP